MSLDNATEIKNANKRINKTNNEIVTIKGTGWTNQTIKKNADDVIDLTPVELLASAISVTDGTEVTPNVPLTSSLALYSRMKVFSFEANKPLPAVEINLDDFGTNDSFYVEKLTNRTSLQKVETSYRVDYEDVNTMTAHECVSETTTYGSPSNTPQPTGNADVTITSILGYK